MGVIKLCKILLYFDWSISITIQYKRVFKKQKTYIVSQSITMIIARQLYIIYIYISTLYIILYYMCVTFLSSIGSLVPGDVFSDTPKLGNPWETSSSPIIWLTAASCAVCRVLSHSWDPHCCITLHLSFFGGITDAFWKAHLIQQMNVAKVYRWTSRAVTKTFPESFERQISSIRSVSIGFLSFLPFIFQ